MVDIDRLHDQEARAGSFLSRQDQTLLRRIPHSEGRRGEETRVSHQHPAERPDTQTAPPNEQHTRRASYDLLINGKRSRNIFYRLRNFFNVLIIRILFSLLKLGFSFVHKCRFITSRPKLLDPPIYHMWWKFWWSFLHPLFEDIHHRVVSKLIYDEFIFTNLTQTTFSLWFLFLFSKVIQIIENKIIIEKYVDLMFKIRFIFRLASHILTFWVDDKFVGLACYLMAYCCT